MSLDLAAIWCERYRPRKLEDLIISDRNREIIKGFKDEIPNLLFTGVSGTGKCLDGDEVIEVYVDDEEYQKIHNYLKKNKFT
jgi:DNA polymerase III delta prime subunit